MRLRLGCGEPRIVVLRHLPWRQTPLTNERAAFIPHAYAMAQEPTPLWWSKDLEHSKFGIATLRVVVRKSRSCALSQKLVKKEMHKKYGIRGVAVGGDVRGHATPHERCTKFRCPCSATCAHHHFAGQLDTLSDHLCRHRARFQPRDVNSARVVTEDNTVLVPVAT